MIIRYNIPYMKLDKKTITNSLSRTAINLTPQRRKSPDEEFGSLFREVQTRQLYSDGKTFVDMAPRRRVQQIKREYKLASQDPNFHLADFVKRHFYDFTETEQSQAAIPKSSSAREHVTNLWPLLVRRAPKSKGSLIALPYDYVVPGGRFNEQFYWDSYFIMLGLAADNQWKLIEGMMKNYAYMIRRFGFIPTANRTYFTSRSQPPFFAHMVKLLAHGKRSKLTYIEYLPYLLAEYRFWTRGGRKVTGIDSAAYARTVRMPGGEILGRYYDNKTTPRPESQREDLETAEKSTNFDKAKVFLDLRAGAESGWDFSSRWFRDPNNIETIHTTDIVPVDLNCLLYDLEQTIVHCYRVMKQPLLAKQFAKRAQKRAVAIRKYCWNEADGFFYDYDFRTGQQARRANLGACFTLYSGIATNEQAVRVAEILERDFLKDGGLTTTLVDSSQQWDAPNGWAPLQWVAIQGLKRYGIDELADTITERWLASTEIVFTERGKMIEKYDVISSSRVGGGGEYPLQDGFGWTNGVYAALYDRLEVPH